MAKLAILAKGAAAADFAKSVGFVGGSSHRLREKRALMMFNKLGRKKTNKAQ